MEIPLKLITEIKYVVKKYKGTEELGRDQAYETTSKEINHQEVKNNGVKIN